ncbi:XRE family transcriptional regulator [Jiangella anatolica]|uniref:XRE family transcriptional regulator n=2 Tax=Jiangella anatolica TaxID=2670374 RepID=A0A2W2BG43_9ACTN|nr:XRE family transcriptional regulator [Jiangella anatolica]
MRADVLRAHHRAIARRRSEQDIQSEFGYRVRALRVERDFSQEELAPLAGMHWSALGHIEAGRRTASLQVISGLAVALDVAPSALLP